MSYSHLSYLLKEEIMFIFTRAVLFFSLTLLCINSSFAAPPLGFSQAKIYAKKYVYFDQNSQGVLGTTYCGCDWSWLGKSGGRTDLDSCGYKIRSPQSKGMISRAQRTEWEHVTTAYSLGNQRQCWQKGGRKNCNATDAVFNAMEANLHNLTPIIGEVNADRSNYQMGVVSNSKNGMYGQCQSKVDFKQRTFEPRNEAKGLVARIHFYMHDRYSLSMSHQQQKLFMAWNKQNPVTAWELERDRRIAKIMGHNNGFVTGERTWTLGHKSSGDGVLDAESMREINRKIVQSKAANDSTFIHGNRNSKIYHLFDCPSYNAMKSSNIINFKTEQEAHVNGHLN
jgi:deoxyribonuclease-1